MCWPSSRVGRVHDNFLLEVSLWSCLLSLFCVRSRTNNTRACPNNVSTKKSVLQVSKHAPTRQSVMRQANPGSFDLRRGCTSHAECPKDVTRRCVPLTQVHVRRRTRTSRSARGRHCGTCVGMDGGGWMPRPVLRESPKTE